MTLSVADIRAEEMISPALKRKIFHPMRQKKNHMEWPLNDTFKKGLRNALTGLYVVLIIHRYVTDK